MSLKRKVQLQAPNLLIVACRAVEPEPGAQEPAIFGGAGAAFKI